MSQPVFRFAPSPTGYLHLGHAYAALYNQKICRMHNGRMLLRLENTDLPRCKPKFELAIMKDLEWIGFEWEGEILRQTDQFDIYTKMRAKLIADELIYPSFMSRSEIIEEVARIEAQSTKWPRDPDGVPHYPGHERDEKKRDISERCSLAQDFAWRLDIRAAMSQVACAGNEGLHWEELKLSGEKFISRNQYGDPRKWGDVVLARKNIPARYHLACVIDDGLQNITHVVRGLDIYHSTVIHRLLQEILNISPPKYCHHELILDKEGRKLSKRDQDTSIGALRASGHTASDIHELIGILP